MAGTIGELDDLPPFKNAVIVAQTTQNTGFFKEVKAWAGSKFPHYKIFDTICDSTENRQAEVRRLADDVDAFVVVGGRDSGNTRRLAGIAGEKGKPVFHIETEAELDVSALSKVPAHRFDSRGFHPQLDYPTGLQEPLKPCRFQG